MPVSLFIRPVGRPQLRPPEWQATRIKMLITIALNFYCCIHFSGPLELLVLRAWPKGGAKLIYAVQYTHIWQQFVPKYLDIYMYKLTAGQTGFVWQNDVQCRNGGRPITSLFILLLADCCTLNIWLTGQIFYCPPICLQLSVIRPKMVEPHCGRQST